LSYLKTPVLAGTVLAFGFLSGLIQSVYAKSYSLSAPLSLQEAERIAVEKDPLKAKHLEMEKAYANESVAAKFLPNPKLNFGLNNFPTDTYSRTQSPMTQVKVGIEQPFPRGKTRRLRSAHKKILAQRQRTLSNNQQRVAVRQTRKNWLDLYYWQRAQVVVLKNLKLFKLMLRVTEDRYRSGRAMQHEVIRAQLEIDLLDDRLIKIKTQQKKYTAHLARWIGPANASRPLAGKLPRKVNFAKLPQLLLKIESHPLLNSDKDSIEARRKMVEIARQSHKPKFSLYASYGQRDERADLSSAGIKMDIPIFRTQRNKKNVIASENKLSAAMLARNVRYLQLRDSLSSQFSIWKLLSKRYMRYRKIIVPKAEINSTTTMYSYQNKRLEFSTLVKARTIELNVKLKLLRLKVDLKKSESELLYLTGEGI